MKAGIDFTGISTPFYCIDTKGNVLLHKRSNKCRDEHGVWDSGGGRLEFGSTLEENVLREVSEEYGCVGEIVKQLPAFAHTRVHNGEKTHWLAVPFIISVQREMVRNNEPEKIDEIGWFTLENLPNPIHPGIQFVLKNYMHHFKKHIR
jgi:8-oxo-dGTP diphosphatase